MEIGDPPMPELGARESPEKSAWDTLEIAPFRRCLRPSYNTRYWHDDKFENNVVVVKYDTARAMRPIRPDKEGPVHFLFVRMHITEDTDAMWTRWAPRMKSVIFKRCFFSKAVYPAFLRHFTKLEYLGFIHCGILPGGVFFHDQVNLPALKAAIVNLKRLTIDFFLGRKDNFAQFLYLAPNIVDLNVNATLQIDMVSKIVDSIDWQTAFNQIQDRGDRLQSLTLKKINLMGHKKFHGINFFQDILDAENIKVKKLEFQDCSISFKNVKWPQHTVNITHLSLVNIKTLTDGALSVICAALTSLKILNLRRSTPFANAGVIHLSQLELSDLSLSECGVSGSPVVTAISSRSLHITSLYLYQVKLDESDYLDIATKLSELQYLEVGKEYTKTLTDAVFKSFCVNFTKLLHLAVYATELTDAAFVPDPSEDRPGGLDNLAKLKYLHFHGILHAPTQETIEKNFKFLSLQHFAVQICEGMTPEGFQALIRNNPHIEILELPGATKITDEVVQFFVENLPKLKRLHVNSCPLLTVTSIDAIKKHAHALKVLNVFQCSLIIKEALDSLAVNHSSLRIIKHESYLNKKKIGLDKVAFPRALAESQ